VKKRILLTSDMHCTDLMDWYGVRDADRQQAWVDAVLACVTEEGRPGVAHPRPEAYWPVDFMPLTEKLFG
jgi:hypothetical protein